MDKVSLIFKDLSLLEGKTVSDTLVCGHLGMYTTINLKTECGMLFIITNWSEYTSKVKVETPEQITESVDTLIRSAQEKDYELSRRIGYMKELDVYYALELTDRKEEIDLLRIDIRKEIDERKKKREEKEKKEEEKKYDYNPL